MTQIVSAAVQVLQRASLGRINTTRAQEGQQTIQIVTLQAELSSKQLLLVTSGLGGHLKLIAVHSLVLVAVNTSLRSSQRYGAKQMLEDCEQKFDSSMQDVACG
jgi:hypothetical protein